MKRKSAVILAGGMALAMLLSGCSAGNEASDEYVTVGGYKGIEVSEVAKPAEVTDEDIDSYIEAVLNQHAVEETVTDRAVESGDTVNIDFVGKMNGEEFENGSGEDYPLVIGSDSFIDGFEDSIIGHTAGETFDWNGVFPDDYGNADMAGKEVTFTITVNGITKSIVPEFTDDFVKTVSEESKTTDEYREEVKAELEEAEQSDYDTALRESVWYAVLEKAEVKKYPEDRLKEVSDALIQQYKDSAEVYGMEYEDFIKSQMGYDLESFEQQIDEAVKETMKQELVAEAIAKEENLRPSDEEFEKEYEKMAESYGYESVDAMREAAVGDYTLETMVLQDIVKEWLAENCIQVKEE